MAALSENESVKNSMVEILRETVKDLEKEKEEAQNELTQDIK